MEALQVLLVLPELLILEVAVAAVLVRLEMAAQAAQVLSSLNTPFLVLLT
jgi:hypothetical protein